MMYGAAPTAFMKQAGADGAARTADGLGMLVGQAAESFHIWHGLRPDPEPAGGAARRSGGGTLKAWRAAPARAAGPGSGSSPA